MRCTKIIVGNYSVAEELLRERGTSNVGNLSKTKNHSDEKDK